MAITFIQHAGEDSGPGIMTFGSPVGNGNLCLFVIGWTSLTINLLSVTTNRSADCTLYHNPTALPDNAHRYALASCVTTSAGSMTITPNWNSTPTVGWTTGLEYSGQHASTPVEATVLSRKAGGGATQDVISDTITSLTVNAVVVGIVGDGNVIDAITTGAGYTGRVTTMTTNERGEVEDKIMVSPGGTTVTFTDAGFFWEYAVGGFVIKPAADALQPLRSQVLT